MASPDSPTDQYRTQQGMGPITQSTDPVVVDWIKRAAAETGADPNVLLATAIQESGARRGQVGDNGTSFGPFQHHREGALGNHTPTWANSYAATLERAGQFAKGQVHHGKGAAAIQKPLDRALYERGVDSHMEQARRIIGKAIANLEKDEAKIKTKKPAARAEATGDDIPGPELLSALMSSAKFSGMPNAGDPASSLQQFALNQSAGFAGMKAPTLPAGSVSSGAPTPSQAVTRPKATKPKTAFKAPAPLTPGGGWAGTQKLADALKAIGVSNGLGATGKRARRLTTSGNVSDHYLGNKTAFAYDLSNGSKVPDKAKDATAMQIATALGADDQWRQMGQKGVLNVTIGGYRYQMLYRTDQGGNHFNHVHIGVKKV